MNDKDWKEICDRILKSAGLKERGNNMTEFNVTIDMKLLGKKLEMVIEKDGNTAVYDYSDGYDLKEKYMLEQIAGVMAESLDCSCVYKGDLKKDKYLVRYMNKMGIINATCAEGNSFAEVAKKFKNWDVIGIEKVAEMRY